MIELLKDPRVIVVLILLLSLICGTVYYFVYKYDYLTQGTVYHKEFVPAHYEWVTETVQEYDHLDGEWEYRTRTRRVWIEDQYFIHIEGFGKRFEKRMSEKIRVGRSEYQRLQNGDTYFK